MQQLVLHAGYIFIKYCVRPPEPSWRLRTSWPVPPLKVNLSLPLLYLCLPLCSSPSLTCSLLVSDLVSALVSFPVCFYLRRLSLTHSLTHSHSLLFFLLLSDHHSIICISRPINMWMLEINVPEEQRKHAGCRPGRDT